MITYYELRWTYDAPDSENGHTSRAAFVYNDDDSEKIARKRLIARMAVVRAVSRNAKFKGYAVKVMAERLDWVE